MLMDHVRMRAYHSAIMKNKSLFEGKVVLDVGTGSGVLSIWAAQAGICASLFLTSQKSYF
jgi:protein arginine N-methyltransferase 1